MSTNFIRAALLLGVCFGTAPAMAQLAPQRETVHLGDLDFGTAAGQRALHHRLVDAVNRVCGDIDRRNLAESAAVGNCRILAMKDALTQVEQAVAARGAKPAEIAGVRAASPAS